MSVNRHPSQCRSCGAPASLADADADALCPACLLATALRFGAMDDEDLGEISLGACGDYQLTEMIGRGGHGIVFLARKQHGTSPVAIKMLASARLAGPDELRRFRLECESVLELDHPHIVKIHAAGEHDDAPYYVMQYAPRGTLATWISAQGPPASRASADLFIELMIKIARAVHYAHERGILHRDLTPSNILIDEKGEPLVSDFGLARMIHAPGGATMTGAALGTPCYMSPEQAEGMSITTAADLYSLGAILYHGLTGRPPFRGDTPLDILRQVISRDAPDPRVTNPWIDRDLAMICSTAMHRQPSRRYASTAALADDLARWQKQEAVTARPLSWGEKSLRLCRRHPVAATLSIVSALAALVLFGFLFFGSLLLQKEKDEAVRQAGIAIDQAAQATRARNQFQLNAYAADLYAGYRAIEEAHLGQARAMIANHIPRNGEADLRGFEWYWLSRLCRGDELQSWQEHSSAVNAVAISPDGKIIASAGRDGRVVLRSIPQGEKMLELPRADAPRGIAEIPLMAHVATRSHAMARKILSAPLNPDEVRMRGRPSKLGDISQLTWSPDGQHLVTAGLGSYIRIWTMPGGELDGLIPETNSTQVEYSSDGKFLCLLCPDDTPDSGSHLRIYELTNLALIREIPSVQGLFAISPNSKKIALLPHRATHIEIHSLTENKPPQRIEHPIALKQLDYSPDGKILYANLSTGQHIAYWQMPDGIRGGQIYPIAGAISHFKISPDGQQIASTQSRQVITLQSIRGTSPALLLRGHEDGICDFEFSLDGRHIVSGGIDRSCRLWSGILPSAPNPAPSATESPQKKSFITVSGNRGDWSGNGIAHAPLTYHPRDTSQEPKKFPGPAESYNQLILSADGRFLAAFSWPRILRVMEISTSQWQAPIRITEDIASAVGFSPDGMRLASGGDDNVIRIRTMPSSAIEKELRGHQGRLISIAFSHDGKTLASSASDATTRLWHIATWRELGTMHRGEILHSLEFSPDDRILRAKTSSGTCREFSTQSPSD